jgi:arsenate reductase-like glutaredoxin family protein
MGVISKDKRKISIYYHSENSIGKQAFAYANVSDKKLHSVDISKTKVTGTQWAELASKLELNVSDLIDTENSYFKHDYGENIPEMEQHDWLKILENKPYLLKYPIVINGENYIQIKSAAELKQYLSGDSAGLEKEPINKQFTDNDRA